MRNTDGHSTLTRREAVCLLSAAAGSGLLGLGARRAMAEPSPETTTIRLALDPDFPVLCWAPKYLAKELLHMEGFTDVQYVPFAPPNFVELPTLAGDHADMSASSATDWIDAINRGLPVVALAGLHAGCVQIFGSDGIRTCNTGCD